MLKSIVPALVFATLSPSITRPDEMGQTLQSGLYLQSLTPVYQPTTYSCLPVTFEDPACDPLVVESGTCDAQGCELDCEFLARGYYYNDQRVEWSGMESTFGAEGALMPTITQNYGCWETKLLGEFYLNQPFDRCVLDDTAERRSYAANFDTETFEISQLLLSVRRGDLEVVVGKMATPFGRTYFPLYMNAKADAPFIRTESILWRETGLLIRYDPHPFVADVAVTNGCEDLDSNSSKGLVSRLAIETAAFAVGISAKVHDGIGSEDQKRYNNHFGADFMVKWRDFTLSGETIYDEYGFRRPGFDPNDITWGRSIYFRDQNYRRNSPITGFGGYLNLGFNRWPWSVDLNYGEFYPQQLGDPRHDVVNRRGIVKLAGSLTPHLEAYGVLLIENGGYVAQGDRPRSGQFLLTGMEYAF